MEGMTVENEIICRKITKNGDKCNTFGVEEMRISHIMRETDRYQPSKRHSLRFFSGRRQSVRSKSQGGAQS